MAKYERGLNREIVAAVNRGGLNEPLTVATVREFVMRRGWNVSDSYLVVALANGASARHSASYRKYFEALGNGGYRVRREFRGVEWQ